MFNEEVDYTENERTEENPNANVNEIVNGSNDGDSVLEYEDEEEYLKIRKDHVFGEIDYTKRKTKIIATIGPSSSEVEDIIKLIDGGMSMCRINYSHGTQKTNARLLRKYQEAKKLRPHKLCGLMMELRGREIRTSEVGQKAVNLKSGQQLFINCRKSTEFSDNKTIYCQYNELMKIVKPNDIMYIDDGKIVCLVTGCEQNGVAVEVKGGGLLQSRRAIKVPGGKHEQLPPLNPLDSNDIINIALKQNFDIVCLPYTIRKKDIQAVRDVIGQNPLQVFAKIDTIEALHNFEEIVRFSDGIILNRVELALELPPEKLMLAQKWMVDRCNQEGKPIIIQSQVLETMIKKQQCTHQEAQDITSSVLEGVDALILSHETSMGQNPELSIIQLAKAIAEGENIIDYEQIYNDIRNECMKQNKKNQTSNDLIATTACNIALENNVDIFICLTESGKISRFVSKYKPFQPILSCSTSSFVCRQSNLSRGIIGYKIPNFMQKQSDRLIYLILKVAKEQGLCMAGNKVLIFITENEGKKNENLYFKMLDIEGE